MNRRGFLGLIGSACGVALFKPLSILVPTERIKGLNHICYSHFVRHRRTVFYQYSMNQAPLIGLLNMKDDNK
jgi:hypothetical protein